MGTSKNAGLCVTCLTSDRRYLAKMLIYLV
jgi:hypothetical protein